MKKLLVFITIAVIVMGMIGSTTVTAILDTYATKAPQKQSKQTLPSEDTTVRPERQSQQPSEVPGSTTVQPERQSQFSPEQQQEDENGNEAAIEEKDEQFTNIIQEEDDEDDDNTADQDQDQDENGRNEIDKKAPIAISGDNIYVAWWTNETGNDEVLFRTSTDAGQIFGDKINLSNTTNADSQDVEIEANDGNVLVTWWEHNATAEEPVVKISTDNGVTFGPLLELAANETIGVGG
jgi:hypothetical protein